MSISPSSPPPLFPTWHALHIPPSELRCDVTLTNGQCFGWRKHPTLPEWTGVLAHTVLTLRQTATDTLYTVHHPTTTPPSHLTPLLRDYFFLDRISLPPLYAQWSSDRRFAAIAPHLLGLRLLRQEPLECLVSFICSSANNIPRITSMLHSLRTHYGEHLTTLPPFPSSSPSSSPPASPPTSPTPAPLTFHAFPTLERLASIDPLELRAHGFGYRADYLTNTAVALQALGGLPFLLSLRSPSHSTSYVLSTLQQLPGVGPKVAACAALFSLDRLDLVPVDTHVHALALRDYGKELSKEVRKGGSVTKRVREEVEGLLRGKFGEYAGWAHSVLFTAELPAFRHRFVKAQGEVEGETPVTETVVVKVEKVKRVEEVGEVKPAGKAKRRGKRKVGADKENVKEEAEDPSQLGRTSARALRSTSTTTSSQSSSGASVTAFSSLTQCVTTTTTTVKLETTSVEEVTKEPSPIAAPASSALPFRVTKHARTIPRIPRKTPPPTWRSGATMMTAVSLKRSDR